MCIFSCDLGGTYTKWGIFKKDELMCHGEFESQASLGGKALLASLIKKINEVKTEYHIQGIAVSSAGTIDHQSGEVIQASDIIPGYQGMNIIDILENEFNVAVCVDNDVNCAMYAEAINKDAKIVFGLTLGTGVGSAIIMNQEIYHGSSHFAGEVGYLKIGGDVLDLTGSTRGLARRVASRKGESVALWDGKRVFEGYLKEDLICLEEIERMIENVSEAIALSVCFLNPDVIVIGGGVMAQQAIILPKIKEKVASKIPETIMKKTKIEAASYGNLAGIYGAYALYKKRCLETL